jgi:hypothetical protein
MICPMYFLCSNCDIFVQLLHAVLRDVIMLIISLLFFKKELLMENLKVAWIPKPNL